jgi:glutathione peroxidase
MTDIFDYPVTTADGSTETLEKYRGQVMLIVNVASKCGLTPQYEGLEALNRADAPRGLQILGFPCNQFGGQEPGTIEEIQEFCSTNFDVTFPILGKVEVNGPEADPLFTYLRAEAPGDFGPESGPLFDHVKSSRPEAIGTDEVKWNFTKFLIGRDGSVIRRYEPTVAPEQIQADLEDILG